MQAPFFGANGWTGILRPVTGGGILPHHAHIELKMTFKEGGAFDFASTYERIKETLSQAVSMAVESGRPSAVDLSSMNLEQLPAYEEATTGPVLQRPIPISSTMAPENSIRGSRAEVSSNDQHHANPSTASAVDNVPPPNEPPPGYEETQQNSIADNLEQSIRKAD